MIRNLKKFRKTTRYTKKENNRNEIDFPNRSNPTIK